MPKASLLLVTITLILCPSTLPAQDQKAKPDDRGHQIVVDTGSGRYGAGADHFDAKQLGVEIYPGAKVDERENDGKGANLFLEWGQDSTRLYVQKYVTTDSPDQVLAFYRKQLSKYGPVLECRNGKPVNKAASELKCGEDENGKGEEGGKTEKAANSGTHDKSIELKAGTKAKQHIVGVQPKDGGAAFQVVYLQQTRRGTI